MKATRQNRADELVLTTRYRESLRAGEPDVEARNELLLRHMPLIESAAVRIQSANRHHADVSELVQEGCFGFVEGLNRFDPSKGYRVSTYCLWWVKNAMHTYIRENRFNDYVGEDDYRLMMKMNSEIAKLPVRFNGSVEISDVAAALGISERLCHTLFQLTRSFLPLEMGLSRNGDVKLIDRLAFGKDARSDAFIDAHEQAAALIDEALSSLSKAEREAVKSYYLYRPLADYYGDSVPSPAYDSKDRQQGIKKLRSAAPIKKAYLLMQKKFEGK